MICQDSFFCNICNIHSSYLLEAQKGSDETLRNALFISLCLLFLLTACSNGSDSMNYVTEDMDRTSMEKGELAEVETLEQEAKEDMDISTSTERKVKYTAHLNAVIQNTEDTMETLKREAEMKNGYMIESSVSEYEETKETHLSFRIPQAEFESFLTIIKNHVKTITSEQVSGTDVTDEYVDLQSRLKAKQQVADRFLQLLNEAEKMEDVIQISKELGNIQEEIEQLQGRIQYLENQTDYATVHLYLQEKKTPEVSSKSKNILEEIKHQWAKSATDIIAFFSALTVFVIGNLPLWIFLFILGSVLFFIGKRFVSSRKKE